MVVPVDDNDNDLHIQLRNTFFGNLTANGNTGTTICFVFETFK